MGPERFSQGTGICTGTIAPGFREALAGQNNPDRRKDSRSAVGSSGAMSGPNREA